MPSAEIQATEPPPAPTVTTSIIGIFAGNGPTEPSVVSVGLLSGDDGDIGGRSAAVAGEHRRDSPARSAMIAAPSAPAAGPDSTVLIGWWTTSAADSTPPLDRMIENGIRRVAVQRGQPVGDSRNIGRHSRFHRGVDQGRHRPLVLAVLGQHLRGQRDHRLGVLRRDDVGHRRSWASLA